MEKDLKIIYTEENLKNIKRDCPNCGATEIYYDFMRGKLRCNYCKSVFEPNELNNIKDVNSLQQRVIGSGARDITSKEHIITLECVNCGAEVVMDTSVATHTRCHWCRSILSINNRIDNGTVPDAILPFSVSKEEAVEEIKKFMSNKQKYALPEFKKDFNPDNVVGVYLPYLLIDAKLDCSYEGRGEYLYNRYSISKNDTRVDTEIYDVYRNFELNVDDLSIESNKAILNKHSARTNNIINSIMPFDTDNCVKFESNYLIGYTSEKRDINIDEVNNKVQQEIKDIAKATISESVKTYNCGVQWKKEDIKVEGSQWMSAYLPVWLYTYTEKVKGQERIHYIAVNGRTKETMGSIPINESKIYKEFLIAEILCIIFAAIIYLALNSIAGIGFLIAMFPILFFYDNKRKSYRNATARFKHEYETKRNINYKQCKDELFETRVGIPVSSDKKYSYVNFMNNNLN